MLSQEFGIEPIIVVVEEHGLAPVATLSDVVRDVGHDRPRKLCRGGSISTGRKY
jgi:hypothetical protein